jgi:hypothetical protein
MAKFRTFVGKLAASSPDNVMAEPSASRKGGTRKSMAPVRICEDVVCRNFKEARAEALKLYRQKRDAEKDLIAFVVCEDSGWLIASGIRPASVQNFGNGYCVDVTPSSLLLAPEPEGALARM